MKVFHARGSSLCLQPYGQPITTVLCFMPPRPHDWMRWTTPSRTFDATTTWQKPLTRSISIMFFMAWRKQWEKSQTHAASASSLSPGVLVSSLSPSTRSIPVYLLCCLHLPIAVQEVALDDAAHDGEALAGLQLRGEGEHPRVFHVQVFVQLQQHQQLRSGHEHNTDRGMW